MPLIQGAGVILPLQDPTPPTDSLLMPSFKVQPPGGDDSTNIEWQLGGRFIPQNCQAAFARAINCEAGGPQIEVDCDGCDSCDDEIEIDPIEIFQPICGTARTSNGGKVYKDRAEKLLKATSHKTVEHAVWTGHQQDGTTALEGVQSLTDPVALGLDDRILAGGAAQSAYNGIDAMIQYAATYGTGGPAMFHVSPSLASKWVRSGDVVRQGGRLKTIIGDHTVVPGAGYTGSGAGNTPTGVDTLQWAYVTSPIFWWASDIEHVESGAANEPVSSLNRVSFDGFDHLQNQYISIARQTFLLWRDDCLHAGVLIDLTSSAGV